MRIALITSSYNYIRDGVALTLNRLVAFLERQGVEVLVFAPVGTSPALDHAGTLLPVPSMAVPKRPEYRLAFPLSDKNKTALAGFAPDIVHLAVAPDPLGYSALGWARRHKVPLVASCHTRFETYLKHYPYALWLKGVLRGYLRHVYAAAREVYVPSQSMLDALLTEGYRGDFKLWPRGIDADLFRPDKRSADFRNRHKIAPEEFVVAFVSRLVREKGLDSLVASLARLDAMGVPHRALIVGDGPERESLARRLPRAVFTGFLTGEGLAEAYASADAFLFPSLTETFGAVTLEALASGLPCVCADATGSRSLVVDGESGYLIAPGADAAYADALARLWRDPALRTAMRKGARMRSLSFSWDAAMARILDYYRAVAEAPR